MKVPKLQMTRYRQTRHWAIWNGSELLVVTLYRKGAQALLDYINTLTQSQYTMSKTNSTKTARPKTIAAETQNGEVVRLKLDKEVTEICTLSEGSGKPMKSTTSHCRS